MLRLPLKIQQAIHPIDQKTLLALQGVQRNLDQYMKQPFLNLHVQWPEVIQVNLKNPW